MPGTCPTARTITGFLRLVFVRLRKLQVDDKNGAGLMLNPTLLKASHCWILALLGPGLPRESLDPVVVSTHLHSILWFSHHHMGYRFHHRWLQLGWLRWNAGVV